MDIKENIDYRNIAILFALIAKEALEEFHDEGKTAMLNAVSKFGQNRGKRMAEKAQSDGYPPDFISYLVYSDMRLIHHKTKVLKRSPFVECKILTCEWCDIWKQENLMDFGKLYCQEIDSAIMKGFNPQSRFKAHGFLTDGKTNSCHFVFLDEVFRLVDMIKYFFVQRKVLRKRGNLFSPFHFHLKELLSILQEEFKQRFGKAGVEVIQRAQKKCFEQYGYVGE
jgi:hypothetical protein